MNPESIPQPGQYYFHYKHFTANTDNDPLYHSYYVIGIAGDAHNDNYDSRAVIYEPAWSTEHIDEYELTCYSRPLGEFMEEVTLDDETTHPRFTLITEEELIQRLEQARKNLN